MNRLLASSLAFALAATVGTASAQSYDAGRGDYPDSYAGTSQSDYARVIRVDPVFESGYTPARGQRCYDSPVYAGGSYDPYRNDRAYDGYRDQRRDGYYDQYGNYRTGSQGGTQAGSTMATVIGGVVGAVVGSQVGGGSARYATSAIGSMVGGLAGKQIYDQSHRQRTATTRVCDPEPVDGRYASTDRAVNAYDVTYEYGGRRYTSRTHYHPGDRIRVRVDVRPD
ncbi:glycine zipper 2TM domain-containing protein [Aerolutibacter ruishenii]|uniref:Uncharacterized protein YcfJ n=1 Tax=Aerolutibacter ruishenii TaxID=686800 RepID=A0A562LPF9_9GAMM|nr:glycine zipper 2TM domain-containing protein [Lysobacter ruishenii]TWI09519.1 uncharacterized protein YcfJ [Lysobacter ruishenii]